MQVVTDGSRTARRLCKRSVQQGRSSSADPRFTFHTSRFTAAESDARKRLADFFNSLLGGRGEYAKGAGHLALLAFNR